MCNVTAFNNRWQFQMIILFLMPFAFFARLLEVVVIRHNLSGGGLDKGSHNSQSYSTS